MVLDGLAGLLTGVLSGFGIGGGSLLILWLTMVRHSNQFTAGGLNLLYFICCAPTALYTHIKNHLIVRQAVIWSTVAGIPTAIGAAYFAAMIDIHWLRKGFGVLLLYVGIKELFCKPQTDADTTKKQTQ